MGRYAEVKEIYQDIKQDKPMMVLLRILLGIIVVLALIITYKALSEPINILGIELNKDKVKHDTLIKMVHDTVKIDVASHPSDKPQKVTANGKTNVQSFDQKGGQTAGEITNDVPPAH